MSISKNKLDYVIINTGYTARIIEKMGFNKIEIISENTGIKYNKNGVYKLSHSYKSNADKYDEIYKLCDLEEEESINDFLNNCLFIYDGLWGDGLYKIGDDSEINKVLGIMDEAGIDKHGVICFKCTNRADIINYVHILEKCNYCKWFSYEGDEYIETDDMMITLAVVDTESG